jgi:Amt family ammonium transporter
VHGLGGILGTVLVAVLAHPALNGAGFGDNPDALTQVKVQLIGVGATVVWSGVMTALMVAIIRSLLGLRASPDEIEEGLDLTSHGERSYTL